MKKYRLINVQEKYALMAHGEVNKFFLEKVVKFGPLIKPRTLHCLIKAVNNDRKLNSVLLS